MNTGNAVRMSNNMMDHGEELKLLNKVFDDLFPICRSITGPGIEQSIDYLQRHMPLKLEKVASGVKVFDWNVPKEWHFKRARLWGPSGELICDSEVNNLHVVNYSEGVDKILPLEDLEPHLHSIEKLPEAIPYVTSYYNRTWGFCLSHKQRKTLKEGDYRVLIESSFKDGGVPFAHCTLPGESEKEVLLTSYLCHPSMANNELSGPLTLLGLYQRIKSWPKRRFTYRFLLNPETIGSLCFLHNYSSHLKDKLTYGLILTCTGGPNNTMRYKESRTRDNVLNKLVQRLVDKDGSELELIKFTPVSGSDERQYCSPGFNFPIGQLSRTPYGQYAGYHNSLDDKEFMDVRQVQRSIDQVERLLKSAEISGKALNLAPYGEPQLGKRGLYPNMNSPENRAKSSDSKLDGRKQLEAILSVLSDADGRTDLIDVYDRISVSPDEITEVIERLEEQNLLSFAHEELK